MQLHRCSGSMDFGSNLSGLAQFSSTQCQYCNMLGCKLNNLGVKKNTRTGYCSLESNTNSRNGNWTAISIVPDYRKKNMQKRNMGQLSFQVMIVPFPFILDFGQKMSMRFIFISFLASCRDCMLLLKSKKKSW